mmetsp:Transcript_14825/g.59365  ORF Transcript_14825/g.59365 Transcript_14825/m.59365 type:complete len:205 (+) Transcript_14825:1972-2586(+)
MCMRRPYRSNAKSVAENPNESPPTLFLTTGPRKHSNTAGTAEAVAYPMTAHHDSARVAPISVVPYTIHAPMPDAKNDAPTAYQPAVPRADKNASDGRMSALRGLFSERPIAIAVASAKKHNSEISTAHAPPSGTLNSSRSEAIFLMDFASTLSFSLAAAAAAAPEVVVRSPRRRRRLAHCSAVQCSEWWWRSPSRCEPSRVLAV